MVLHADRHVERHCDRAAGSVRGAMVPVHMSLTYLLGGRHTVERKRVFKVPGGRLAEAESADALP